MRKIRTVVILLMALGVIAGCAGTPAEKKPSSSSFHPNLQRYPDPEINKVIILAWGKVQNGEFESAAIDFEQLVRNKYEDYDIDFGAGLCFHRSGNQRKALDYLGRAIAKRPDHFVALFQRADAYLRMNNHGAARRDLRQIIELRLTEKLVCGYYFNDNDLATATDLETTKMQARALLDVK